MIMDGCQGKPRTPTIREKICPVCGNTIEIFSTDTQVTCDRCGFVAYNDALSCVQWCQYARKCVGDEMYERMMEIARHQKAERATKEEREMTVAEQKAALRKKLRTMERILPQSYRDESAAAICRRVTELPEYQAAQVVFDHYHGPAALLCREKLLSEEVPMEPHDKRFALIVTEKDVYRV